jgi:hypothetical protein
MDAKPLLQINGYHLTTVKAEQAVIDLLKAYHKQPITGKWKDVVLLSTRGDTEYRKTFQDMVKEMAATGVVKDIQFDTDHNDKIFGGNLSLGGSSGGAISAHVSHAGYESDVEGPGQITPVEDALMFDILYFRERACAHSGEPGLAKTTAYFRSYLYACLAMIEAFQNRQTFIAEHLEGKKPEYAELRRQRGFDRKTDMWMKLFTTSGLDDLKKSEEWRCFQNIKGLRDNTIHSNHLYQAYSLKQIANSLNEVRLGIGGLMKLFRQYQNLPSLAFIERLRTAPEVAPRRSR